MKRLDIRRERQSREWTLSYVGKQVGITKSAIYDIETGRRKPSFEVLIKLLILFGKIELADELENFFDKTNKPDGNQV